MMGEVGTAAAARRRPPRERLEDHDAAGMNRLTMLRNQTLRNQALESGRR